MNSFISRNLLQIITLYAPLIDAYQSIIYSSTLVLLIIGSVFLTLIIAISILTCFVKMLIARRPMTTQTFNTIELRSPASEFQASAFASPFNIEV